MSEKGKLKRFWIWELTRPAFEDWLENEPALVAIIGIGSIEQHGPHLPLGTDSLYIRDRIHKIAERTNSVCIHPCWPGYSPHHMGFKGTVTFSEETLLGVIMDTIGSLARHGIKRIVLLNAHGGNTNIMKHAAQLAKRRFRVMVATPTGPSETETAKKIDYAMKKYNEVHSGPRETAGALVVFPELVEMWRLEGWEPTYKIHPKLMGFMDPEREDYELVSQVRQACGEPDTDDFTSSGVYAVTDPRTADVELLKKSLEERTQFIVDFINLWKTIPIPPAFRDS
jgi:creatinine amidohydrolase/Fe(II)-dependent formamide hydrolase-like protein